MIIRLSAAIRRRLDCRERGAATLESVGMYVVAAILAVAVLLTATGSAPVIGDKFRQAVCMLTTLGQGSCEASVTSAADHKPTEPCVVSEKGHTGAVEASFVVTVGTSEKLLVEKLDDGRSRVTRGTGGKVGVGVGVGFNVSATWDDKTYGGAAKADASVAANFAGGEVYYADNDKEVAELVSAHREAVVKQAVGSAPAGSLLVGVVNVAEGVFDVGDSLPPVDETYIEGGGTVDLKAQATALTSSAQAGGSAAAVLGTRLGRDGSSTTYYKAALDGNIGAATWTTDEKSGTSVYAKAGIEAKREAVFEVERDAKGIITAVRVKSAQSGNREATADEGAADGPGKHEYSSETVTELPIRSATDQAIAQRLLNGAGLGPMGGFNDIPEGTGGSLPLMNPMDVMAAGKDFAEAAGRRGFVTRQTFDDSRSSSYGANFDAEEIAKVSGGVTVDKVDRTSTGLEYWDGTTMVPKKGCGST